jgi:crossover junction endodeoxyribonuclease RuvC
MASPARPAVARGSFDRRVVWRGGFLSSTIGIDPGSRITGYGVVEQRGHDIVYVGSGIIRVKAGGMKQERLLYIKEELDSVLDTFKPASMAVEEIFLAKNPKSILTLGEARGVVLLSAAQAGIPVYEYTPREVKSSVVGLGQAHKGQVAAMIRRLLKLEHEPATTDESDALAVAFCHELRMSGAMRGLR